MNEDITFREFVILIRQMRHKQKRYRLFGHDELGMNELEKEVDSIVGKLLDTQTEINWEE